MQQTCRLQYAIGTALLERTGKMLTGAAVGVVKRRTRAPSTLKKFPNLAPNKVVRTGVARNTGFAKEEFMEEENA